MTTRQHLPLVSNFVKDGDSLSFSSQRCIPPHNMFTGLEESYNIVLLLISTSSTFAHAYGHYESTMKRNRIDLLIRWPSLVVKYHPEKRSPLIGRPLEDDEPAAVRIRGPWVSCLMAPSIRARGS